MKVQIEVRVSSIKEGKINLISPCGYGDTMILCGLKDAIEEHYGASVNYIIKPQHEILMRLYGITEYELEEFDKKELVKISKETPEIVTGRYFVAHPKFLNDNEKLLNSFINLEISSLTLFKKTLGLSEDVGFKYPVNKPRLADSLREKIESISSLDKVVLISPEAFSTKKVDMNILESEVNRLKSQGFTVISSVTKKSEMVKGSVYIPLTIEEALAIGANCAAVLTVRSGFTDMMVPFVQKLTIFYPDIDTYNLYSIRQYNQKEIREIIVPEVSIDKMGPFFHLEHKSNEKIFRFCLSIFRVKKRNDSVKYSVFGLPVWKIKLTKTSKKHYLFSMIPIFVEDKE